MRSGAGAILITGDGASREGSHRPRRCDPADGVITGVRDIGITTAIGRDGRRRIESCGGAGPVSVADDAGCTRQSGHHTAGCDLVDLAARIGFGHIHGALNVHRDAGPQATRRAGQGSHNALRRDAADRLVPRAEHVKIAGTVNRDSRGRIELRGGTYAVRMADHTGRTRQRRHDTRGGDLANRII